jgi:hypothetical protein
VVILFTTHLGWTNELGKCALDKYAKMFGEVGDNFSNVLPSNFMRRVLYPVVVYMNGVIVMTRISIPLVIQAIFLIVSVSYNVHYSYSKNETLHFVFKLSFVSMLIYFLWHYEKK